MKKIREFYIPAEWWGMDFYEVSRARRFADKIRHKKDCNWQVRRRGSIVALRSIYEDAAKPWAVWEAIISQVKPLGDKDKPDFDRY